jgi:hypothetical protein
MFVEAFVPSFPVEALDVGVLDRLAGWDVMQAHTVLLGPAQHPAAGQVRSVIQHDDLGQAADRSQRVQHPPDTLTRKAKVGLGRQTLAGALVDHSQDPQAPPAASAVLDEVPRPAQVGLRHKGW